MKLTKHDYLARKFHQQDISRIFDRCSHALEEAGLVLADAQYKLRMLQEHCGLSVDVSHKICDALLVNDYRKVLQILLEQDADIKPACYFLFQNHACG